MRLIRGKSWLMGAVAGAGSLAAITACGGDEAVVATQPPQIIERTVVVTQAPQIVKETVIVAGTPQIIEKTVVVTQAPQIVKETVVIEKVVIQTATPAPAPTTAPVLSVGTVTAAADNIFNPIGTPRFNAVQSPHLKLGFVEAPYRLVRASATDRSLVPQQWLGLGWTMGPAQAYVDVKIRKGVKFHKGYGEMTADDWVFSFNDANPTLTAGATNDMGGDIAALLKGVEKIDAETVRMTFNVFQSNWLERYMSTFWEGHVIYSKKVFDEKGAEGMRDVLVGTGPLQVVKYEAAKEIVMEAFPEYWSTPSGAKSVRVIQVIETATRKAMLQTGLVEITHLPVKDRVDVLKEGFALGNEGFLAENALAFGGNWWEKTHVQKGTPIVRTLDLTKPWIGNPDDAGRMASSLKVREALAISIDRAGLNKGIMLDQGAPGHTPGWPVSEPGFKKSWEYAYDLGRAKALLADAGYKDGFTVEFWVGPSGDGVTLGEAIGGTWQSELNIKTNFDRTVYGTTFRPSIVNRSVNKIWWCGTDGINFPVTWPKGFLLSTMSDGGFMCGSENAKFGQIFLDMAKASDPAALKTLATAYFDEMRATMLQVGVIDVPQYPVYNATKVARWDMLPEGKGVVGGLNSLFAVKLK